MNSTQQSMNVALQTAMDCAVLTTQSLLKEKGVNCEEEEVRGMVRQRFDYILEDSGVKANLMGRAVTVDQALNGEKNSAIRNRNWMTAYDTVKKLDCDVNQLRMLLSAKGIDMKMRVLNTCFKVYRKPGKSSSVIEARPLAMEKLRRGEIIEVDFEDEKKEVVNRKEEYVSMVEQDQEESFKSEISKLKEQLDDQMMKYTAYQKMVTVQHREWKAKIDKMQNELEQTNRTLASALSHMDHLNRVIALMDTERKSFIQATTESVRRAVIKSQIDDAARDEYLISIDAVTSMDDDSIKSFTDTISMIVEDYSNAFVAAKGLANRLGYTMQFEPTGNQ